MVGYGASKDMQIHEVLVEFIEAQAMFSGRYWLVAEMTPAEVFDALPVFDLLLDELMLTATESYYQSSVRDLEKRAIHDTMTELYNKQYFAQRLAENDSYQNR